MGACSSGDSKPCLIRFKRLRVVGCSSPSGLLLAQPILLRLTNITSIKPRGWAGTSAAE